MGKIVPFSARRSALCLKVALVMVHLIYAGVLFLFDGGLIEKTKREPWYANSSIFFILYYFWVLIACQIVEESLIDIHEKI